MSINISQAIKEAIIALNGSIDYDEKEIVDEEVKAVNKLVLTIDLANEFKSESTADIATKQDAADDEFIEIYLLNFCYLVENGMNTEDAAKIAVLRATIVNSGGYFPDAHDLSTTQHTYLPEILTSYYPANMEVEPEEIVITDSNKAERVEPWSQTAVNVALKAGNSVKAVGAKVTLPADRTIALTLFAGFDMTSVRRLAKYLPVMGHMAFTKFGHHYVDNNYFKVAYEKQFRSLQMMSLEPSWNKCNIIYNAIHWMGPYTMRFWCANLISRELMPRPLAIKFPLIPAGAALVCSTVAVLRAAAAIPGFDAFFKLYHTEWDLLTEVTKTIKRTPYVFHVRSDLFGESSSENKLDEAKTAAIILAPCAQAFINRYAQNTDLARIQTIKKHAEANIGLMRRYEAIFTGSAYQTRTESRRKTMHEMIMGTRSPKAEVVEVEENE